MSVQKESKKESILIWVWTNKTAVVWNFDLFSCTDIPRKGYFWFWHFFIPNIFFTLTRLKKEDSDLACFLMMKTKWKHLLRLSHLFWKFPYLSNLVSVLQNWHECNHWELLEIHLWIKSIQDLNFIDSEFVKICHEQVM